MTSLMKNPSPQNIQMYTISDFLMKVKSQGISIGGMPIDYEFLQYVKKDIALNPHFIDSIVFKNLTPVVFDVTRQYTPTSNIDFADQSIYSDSSNQIMQIIRFSESEYAHDFTLFLKTFYSEEVVQEFISLSDEKRSELQNRFYSYRIILNVID
jgi:hypothetical protein